MKKIIGYLCAFLCIFTQTLCINCPVFARMNNIKIDSTYVHYKERIDRLDKRESNREKLAEQFLELCNFGKESFINDITEAVHKISKTNVGIELIYILIDKIVDGNLKIKFIKMPWSGFADKSSQELKNELVMWLDEDDPKKMSLNIFDRNASITRQADFTEILFHELCHVMHYMFVGCERYKNKRWSSTAIETIFNFKNFAVWPNDEELYTVTGLSIDDSTGKISYNPINENAFANELGLSVREVYDKPKVFFSYCTLLNELYEHIGFYD